MPQKHTLRRSNRLAKRPRISLLDEYDVEECGFWCDDSTKENIIPKTIYPENNHYICNGDDGTDYASSDIDDDKSIDLAYTDDEEESEDEVRKNFLFFSFLFLFFFCFSFFAFLFFPLLFPLLFFSIFSIFIHEMY